MTPLERFLAYFEDFERTYVDDDWSRLEQYFAPDAVYRVEGGGSFDCVLEGRAAIFAGIRRFLDGFDRKCTREIRSSAPPAADGDSVRVRGVAAYTRGDSPEILLDLEEEAVFRDGVIVALTDRYFASPDSDMRAWLAKWGKDLSPSYV